MAATLDGIFHCRDGGLARPFEPRSKNWVSVAGPVRERGVIGASGSKFRSVDVGLEVAQDGVGAREKNRPACQGPLGRTGRWDCERAEKAVLVLVLQIARSALERMRFRWLQ